MAQVFRAQEHPSGGLVFGGQEELFGQFYQITPDVVLTVAPLGEGMTYTRDATYAIVGGTTVGITVQATMSVPSGASIAGGTALSFAVQATTALSGLQRFDATTTLHLFPFGASMIYDGGSTVRWPSDLPDGWLLDGYTESPQDRKLRSGMDAGAPKQRARFTAGIDQFRGSILMNLDEVDRFELFYDNELQQGTLPFRWKHPRKQTPVDLRIIGAYSVTPVNGRDYTINLLVEKTS